MLLRSLVLDVFLAELALVIANPWPRPLDSDSVLQSSHRTLDISNEEVEPRCVQPASAAKRNGQLQLTAIYPPRVFVAIDCID